MANASHCIPKVSEEFFKHLFLLIEASPHRRHCPALSDGGFLSFKGVLSSPMLYLSEYFESDRENYYARLQEISDHGRWEEWISYFLDAAVKQSTKNIDKAKRIQALHDAKKQTMRDLTKSRYSIDALDCIFHMPVFNTLQFKKVSGIPDTTADRILKGLVDGGVIRVLEKGSGVRPTVFAFPELLEIVEG